MAAGHAAEVIHAAAGWTGVGQPRVLHAPAPRTGQAQRRIRQPKIHERAAAPRTPESAGTGLDIRGDPLEPGATVRARRWRHMHLLVARLGSSLLWLLSPHVSSLAKAQPWAKKLAARRRASVSADSCVGYRRTERESRSDRVSVSSQPPRSRCVTRHAIARPSFWSLQSGWRRGSVSSRF